MRDDSPWDWEGFRLKKRPDSSNRLQENKKNRAFAILYRLGLRVVNKERGLEGGGEDHITIGRDGTRK